MWDVEVIYEKLNVREFQERENVSKQVASRKLRYKFYKEQMKRFDADYLALGHHQDDQVETMLMSLTRSASSNAFLGDRKSTRLNSSHVAISYAVFCLKKKII